MTFESLKITISQSLEKISYQETTEEEKLINKIITGVILYHHISSLIDNNTRLYSDSIKETSDNYAKTFYNLVTELKKKYISYKELTRVIKNYKIQNFLQLTETQINNLYNIYCNKQERREFNKNTYSQFMYNIYRISEDQNSKLEKIHNKVIVPIVEYYESFNNVYDQDVVVDNISDEIPGKIINLAISGVSCSKIYADIRRDIFNVKSLLYSYEITKDGFIQLVFK